MVALIMANWPVLLLVAALLLSVLLLFRRKPATRQRHHAPDALDEGAAPAARNQALIDAPSAVTVAKAAQPEPVSLEPLPVAPVPAPPPVAVQTPPPAAKVPKSKTPPKAKPAPKPKAAKAPAAAKPRVARSSQPVAAPSPSVPPAKQAAPAPAPVTVVEPPKPSASTSGDDLSRIKGLGPKLQSLLPTLGVTSFAQIAGWTEADLARIDGQLGVFAGRPVRDSWVEQAKFLAAGDVAGFEAKFGKV